MIYRKFQNLELSALGMGAMRLPVVDGNNGVIDEKATAEMVKYAFEKGINYFDTAWGYHDGNSEIVMGKVLKNYPRESFYLASKFPGYDVNNMTKVQEIFEKQLKKCQVEYFDFYLFHNVCEINIDEYLNEKYGILPYLLKQKELGRIRHLGFSAHGDYDVVKRFLDAYGKYLEFGQIQLNYIDWNFQKAKDRVDLLNEYHIPIWVMEPLRGGKLATLDEKNMAQLKNLRPEETVPAWAFRFLQSIKGVTMILSGMSNFTQLAENIQTFETDAPLNKQEMETIVAIGDNLANGVPCTSCKYCTEKCPMELNIPRMMEIYNESVLSDGGFLAHMQLGLLPEGKRPNDCLKCRQCEQVCPQEIKISEVLADFAEKMK